MTIAVINPSFDNGKVTCKNVRTEPTPRSRDASSRRWSILSSDANSGMMKNGR